MYAAEQFDTQVMLDELPEYARMARDGELTEYDKLTLLTHVAYLQETGVIKPDSYNGMLYVNPIDPITRH